MLLKLYPQYTILTVLFTLYPVTMVYPRTLTNLPLQWALLLLYVSGAVDWIFDMWQESRQGRSMVRETKWGDVKVIEEVDCLVEGLLWFHSIF